MRIFAHAVRMAQGPRDCRNEDRPEINSENDPCVGKQTARTRHHHIGHRRIQNVLHLGVGGHEAFQEKKHPMQLTRVRAEQTQQVPEKQRAGRQCEKKQIRHLCSQTGCLIGRRFPNHPAQNTPDESEILHVRESLLCPAQISIKVRISRVSRRVFSAQPSFTLHHANRQVVKKRILILTASFGEGHNAAARGVRDGLTRVAPQGIEVELRDLFAEAYGPINELVRRSYLGLVNFAPRAWGSVYRWLDRKNDFDKEFERFFRLKDHFTALLDRFQPDVVICTFPAYLNLLREIEGANGDRVRPSKSVVVVTDSITINAAWYRCAADYFLVANEQSASVLLEVGVVPEKIKVFGFPVSPKFAEFAGSNRVLPSNNCERRVLYMIHAATGRAPDVVRRLATLGVDLTVTIGRADKLRAAIEAAADGAAKIVGWTDELPRMLHESHLLVGKAGGATVQETIAAGCPMIINQVVSGQEEGNARLIVETNSGVIALSPAAVAAQVQRAFADDAKQWREWAANISKLSRPRAALDIAEFLLSI